MLCSVLSGSRSVLVSLAAARVTCSMRMSHLHGSDGWRSPAKRLCCCAGVRLCCAKSSRVWVRGSPQGSSRHLSLDVCAFDPAWPVGRPQPPSEPYIKKGLWVVWPHRFRLDVCGPRLRRFSFLYFCHASGLSSTLLPDAGALSSLPLFSEPTTPNTTKLDGPSLTSDNGGARCCDFAYLAVTSVVCLGQTA